MSSPTLSVVVPCYNEAENIAAMIQTLRGIMPELDLLVVDDGSRDRSLAIMRELAAADPHLRVLAHRRNAGQSASDAHEPVVLDQRDEPVA